MPMKALFYRSLLALLCAVLLVAASYFLVDRPVAFFVHDHHLSQYRFLEWLTYIADGLTTLAPWAIGLGVLWRLRGPLARYQKVGLAASVSLTAAAAGVLALKFVAGRYWPETWIDNNPSLIGDGAYAFHPFHAGVVYGSFPSGHTARTTAFVSVVWLAYPRLRWVCALFLPRWLLGWWAWTITSSATPSAGHSSAGPLPPSPGDCLALMQILPGTPRCSRSSSPADTAEREVHEQQGG